MSDQKKQFAGRLRDALEKAGYEPRPSVLEREFNLRCWNSPVTLHGVRRWLKGETLPTEDKMIILADWLNVSPRYLRFGGDTILKVEEKRRILEDLAYVERETLEAYLQLPPDKRRIIREVILTFAAQEKASALSKQDKPSRPGATRG